jgi:hypothetical protein
MKSIIRMAMLGLAATTVIFSSCHKDEITKDTDSSGTSNTALADNNGLTSRLTGTITGFVFPADTKVMAIYDTDTTLAVPDTVGRGFRITVPGPARYTIFYDGQNGYRDTTLYNISVRDGAAVTLPAITLHQ